MNTIAIADDRGARVVTLDRERALNAFDHATFDAVATALIDASADDAIACVVIAARGRAFSAGSDLAGGEEPDPGPYTRFLEALESFPKPAIAAVNGLAVGIGFTLLGHCDLVIAGRSARFRAPFASLGLCPEAGSTVTLPALMGRQAAAHALFTGAWVGADEAKSRGLVWRIVEDAELQAEALALAHEIAAAPVEALTATKRLLLAARLPAARVARAREDSEFQRLAAGPAHAAALQAFRDQRRPEKREGP